MAQRVTMLGPRWLRLLPGAALVGVVLVAAATTWDALLANNPAYPATLLVALLVGVWLVVSGLRPTRPTTPGAVRGLFRGLAALAGLGLAAVLLWLAPYPADDTATDALESTEAVTVGSSRADIVFEPTDEARGGLVLYPGALVDPRAYARHAHDIAEQGFQVVVLKCPYDLALLCTGAAEGHITPDLDWSVGGHSLGGTAASLFADTSDAISGLVFWASYPQPDLSGRDDLAVTSISGSQDGLSTPGDIEASRANLPSTTEFVEVEGANHASFGSYGPQAGDGEATLDAEAAREQIVLATIAGLERAGTASQAQ
jgi:predicted alpha/beta-hydrolase family hydrolase